MPATTTVSRILRNGPLFAGAGVAGAGIGGAEGVAEASELLMDRT